MKKIVIALLVLVFPILTFSQNCSDHMNVQKSGIRYPWKYDSQSKSGLFTAGKTSQLNIVCNEGKEYKVSFLTSSNIMNYTNAKVTDENGNTYFVMGNDPEKKKELEKKKEFLLSLENSKLKIKTGKKKIELDANINSLKLEIQKSQQEIEQNEYTPKTFFEFTPAETMKLIITITVNEECTNRGCVGVLITNRKLEGSGF